MVAFDVNVLCRWIINGTLYHRRVSKTWNYLDGTSDSYLEPKIVLIFKRPVYIFYHTIICTLS